MCAAINETCLYCYEIKTKSNLDYGLKVIKKIIRKYTHYVLLYIVSSSLILERFLVSLESLFKTILDIAILSKLTKIEKRYLSQ